MSHYTVLVISSRGKNNVDTQLAPYDENMEMAEYVRGEVTQENLDRFVEYYTEKDETLKDLSIEELYEEKGMDWNGEYWQFQEDGTILEYSTYNPKSKWDWYQIGGRWAGSLLLKEGVEPTIPVEFSWGWSEEEKAEALKRNIADQAHVKDIDWEGMRDSKAFDSACRFWELYVEGQKPENEEDEKLISFTMYKPEYYLDKYKDKTTYATCQTNFTTYAVLKDGEWFAPGEMGWFGMSSEDNYEGLDWEMNFFDRFIKDLPENALLTVVDCHI